MDYKKAGEELRQNGYAVIEGFLTNEEVTALKERMKEILDDLDPAEHQNVFSTTNQPRNDYFMNSGDKIAFFFEEGALDKDGNLTVDKQVSVNKIGHALHCQDPVFSRISQSDKMKALVKEGIQFDDPIICQSMYIFKQPKIGGIVRPHQDSTFMNTTPKRLVGVWIPLEDALIDNSCIWAIPGSHTGGVHNNHYMVRNVKGGPEDPAVIFTGEPKEYDDSQFKPVEMKAGSLLLIHGEVVHKSEPNTSTRSRHAYTFHLFENKNTDYSELNWLQPTEKGTFHHLFQ